MKYISLVQQELRLAHFVVRWNPYRLRCWAATVAAAAVVRAGVPIEEIDEIKAAGYVCGIVLLNHGDQPWSYARYRMIETVLGIGAAMLVTLIPKLVRTNGSDCDET